MPRYPNTEHYMNSLARNSAPPRQRARPREPLGERLEQPVVMPDGTKLFVKKRGGMRYAVPIDPNKPVRPNAPVYHGAVVQDFPGHRGKVMFVHQSQTDMMRPPNGQQEIQQAKQYKQKYKARRANQGQNGMYQPGAQYRQVPIMQNGRVVGTKVQVRKGGMANPAMQTRKGKKGKRAIKTDPGGLVRGLGELLKKLVAYKKQMAQNAGFHKPGSLMGMPFMFENLWGPLKKFREDFDGKQGTFQGRSDRIVMGKVLQEVTEKSSAQEASDEYLCSIDPEGRDEAGMMKEILQNVGKLRSNVVGAIRFHENLQALHQRQEEMRAKVVAAFPSMEDKTGDYNEVLDHAANHLIVMLSVPENANHTFPKGVLPPVLKSVVEIVQQGMPNSNLNWTNFSQKVATRWPESVWKFVVSHEKMFKDAINKVKSHDARERSKEKRAAAGGAAPNPAVPEEAQFSMKSMGRFH